MLAREYAIAIVAGDTLVAKLVQPPELELEDAEPALILQQPARPAELAIARRGSVYIEFEVPVNAIKPTQEGWLKSWVPELRKAGSQ